MIKKERKIITCSPNYLMNHSQKNCVLFFSCRTWTVSAAYEIPTHPSSSLLLYSVKQRRGWGVGVKERGEKVEGSEVA